MRPGFSFYNFCYGARGYAKRLSELVFINPTCVHGPYTNDLSRQKPRLANLFSSWLSIFVNFVDHVVFLGTKKQVPRINTKLIVTLVENKEASWYGAVMNCPAISVGAKRLGIFIKFSVSIVRYYATPNPAFLRFVYFSEKIFAGVYWHHGGYYA